MSAWPLPLLATLTGGAPTPRYCSSCLDRHQRGAPVAWRAGMHPACREVLEAICTASAADEVGAA